MLLRCLIAFVLSFSFSGAIVADTFIYAGRLIDGENDQIRNEVTVVVADGKIERIVDGYMEPGNDDKVVDLKSATVMPGLMDMHTHVSGQLSKQSYTERFFTNEAEIALRSSVFAEKTLMAGFTTVRDLGDNGVNTLALRKAIDRGWIVGPRIYTSAKAIGTTGGHADPTNGLKGQFRRDANPTEGVINGAIEARRAVRQRYKDGAQLIKLTATGGVLSLASSGDNPQFTQDELNAVVETARDYDMTVAVHAHGAEGMKRAVLAGVDSIEHGTYMTDEIMELMKQRGTYMVPTLLAGAWVAKKAEEEDFFPPMVRVKAATIGPIMEKTFAKAYKSGVRIAFGTDSGVSPHGENALEFELMVIGGMPPMQAIQAATREASRLLKIDDELGTLEAGKIADIVAVDGNPLDDIKSMSKVVFVMKGGEIFKGGK